MSMLGNVLRRHQRARGQKAQAQGDRTEARVVTALRRPSRPSWILAVRRARASEDRTGIDVVVDTSDGWTLFLQVKSSKGGARKWRREHAKDTRLIRVVVVRPADDFNTIYGRALGALILLRERAEACRAAPETETHGP
jgi:hypothetical protein